MRGVEQNQKLKSCRATPFVGSGPGAIRNRFPLVVEGVRFIGTFVDNRGVRPYKLLEAMHKAAAAVSSQQHTTSSSRE